MGSGRLKAITDVDDVGVDHVPLFKAETLIGRDEKADTNCHMTKFDLILEKYWRSVG